MNNATRGAALFDVDGTLVDSVDFHAKAWQEAFDQFGHRIAFRKIREQIGKGGDQLMPVFLTASELRRYGTALEDFRGELFRAKYMEQVRAFPGVADLFRALRRSGWKIALASSADGEDLERYEKLCGITRLVDSAVTAEDVQKSKPHPDALQVARRKLRLKPSLPCVMIGDSPYDAIAAKKARMLAVGVLSGGFGRRKLTAAGCSEIYREPSDLLRRLGSSRIFGISK